MSWRVCVKFAEKLRKNAAVDVNGTTWITRMVETKRRICILRKHVDVIMCDF